MVTVLYGYGNGKTVPDAQYWPSWHNNNKLEVHSNALKERQHSERHKESVMVRQGRAYRDYVGNH